jgi:hypothetical protein
MDENEKEKKEEEEEEEEEIFRSGWFFCDILFACRALYIKKIIKI